jgi:hypothetical protein
MVNSYVQKFLMIILYCSEDGKKTVTWRTFFPNLHSVLFVSVIFKQMYLWS